MAVVPSPRPLARPLMSPRLALGGMLPASVLVLPAAGKPSAWPLRCLPNIHGASISAARPLCRWASIKLRNFVTHT